MMFDIFFLGRSLSYSPKCLLQVVVVVKDRSQLEPPHIQQDGGLQHRNIQQNCAPTVPTNRTNMVGLVLYSSLKYLFAILLHIIGWTLKPQLKRYLCYHHVLLLLLSYLKTQATLPLGTPNFYHTSMLTPEAKPKTIKRGDKTHFC